MILKIRLDQTNTILKGIQNVDLNGKGDFPMLTINFVLYLCCFVETLRSSISEQAHPLVSPQKARNPRAETPNDVEVPSRPISSVVPLESQEPVFSPARHPFHFSSTPLASTSHN